MGCWDDDITYYIYIHIVTSDLVGSFPTNSRCVFNAPCCANHPSNLHGHAAEADACLLLVDAAARSPMGREGCIELCGMEWVTLW